MLGPDDVGPVCWGWVKTRKKKGTLNTSIFPVRSSLFQLSMLTPYCFLLFLGKSFREQQCEKYNAYNYTDIDGNLLQWVPKYSGVSPRDRCKLFCRARGRSEFKVFEAKVSIVLGNSDPQMRRKVTYHPPWAASVPAIPSLTFPSFSIHLLQVIDGTLCGPETLAICVHGQCVKAGCDHVVDSPRKLDKCGVCGGKGNSCRKVSGSLNPSR